MVEQNNIRSRGVAASTEDAAAAGMEIDKMIEVSLPEEDPRHMQSPKFARMRFNWQTNDEKQAIDRARIEVDRRIMQVFADAFSIMEEISSYARIQEVDRETGEYVFDDMGSVIWKVLPSGRIDEDFSRLTRRQKEHFIGLITVRLFAWEQMSGEMKMDALMSKAVFEEKFALGYERPIKGTIEDRTSYGNIDASQDRYLAIYMTALSHRADAIVRSMDRIALRLRDVLTA